MRVSKYNHFVEWNNFHIGVNTMTGCKLFLTNIQYELFCEFHNDHQESLMNDTETYDLLVNGGFIIDSSIDEFEVLKVAHTVAVYNNTYRMTIMPTLNCNLRCWYCYEKHIPSRMTDEVMQRVLIFVGNILKSGQIKRLELDWFGGEPLLYFEKTLHPLALKIKDLLKDSNIEFLHSITTNGVLLNEDKILKLSGIELSNFQITIDGCRLNHNKSRVGHDKAGTYDTIINNINSINALCPESHVCVRINYSAETLIDIEQMVDDINVSPRISFFFEKIWQLKEEDIDREYMQERLDEIRDYINKRGNVFEDRHYTYCKGYTCYADTYNQIIINYDGKLFKCTARDFSDDSTSVGYLDKDGNVKLNGSFYKRFQKIPFDNDTCRDCSIVPICLGACSQKMLENPERLQICNSKAGKILALHNELYDNMIEYINEKIT